MMDKAEKPLVKVWCDGCYDLVHFGHANSLRQAKALGDYLVVGVHSDEEISRHKGGPPVFTFEERCTMIAAIKWVDEVVRGSPYVTTLETLDEHGCAFCCHGDDVTVTDDGTDTYHEIKAAGRYREVSRTAGVSTTGLVHRILGAASRGSPWTGGKFLLTTERIVQFCDANPPEIGDVVVYVAGDFDLLHVGHLQLLERARAMGDYLLVGLYGDQMVREQKGDNHPVMTLQERLLGLLACRYVSNVVIEAPLAVTKELMDTFKIDLVVGEYWHGSEGALSSDPYEYPKKLNKFIVIDCAGNVTTDAVIERIVKNKFQYMARNERKEKKELELINEIENRTKCAPSTNLN